MLVVNRRREAGVKSHRAKLASADVATVAVASDVQNRTHPTMAVLQNQALSGRID